MAARRSGVWAGTETAWGRPAGQPWFSPSGCERRLPPALPSPACSLSDRSLLSCSLSPAPQGVITLQESSCSDSNSATCWADSQFSWPPDLWGLLLGQGRLESRTQSFWGWQVAVPGGATAPTGTSLPGGSVETVVTPTPDILFT